MTRTTKRMIQSLERRLEHLAGMQSQSGAWARGREIAAIRFAIMLIEDRQPDIGFIRVYGPPAMEKKEAMNWFTRRASYLTQQIELKRGQNVVTYMKQERKTINYILREMTKP